jgi:hypothetical protein
LEYSEARSKRAGFRKRRKKMSGLLTEATEEEKEWENLSYEEKNERLFLKEKRLLETFLEKGAISREQYEKSLGDLTEKTGHGEGRN